MPKNIFKRIGPGRDTIRQHQSLRSIAHLLQDDNLFHLNRHSVSRAFAIGLAVAMTPVYGHMLIAALLAVWVRANLALSIALVWISNPLTFPFVLYAEYWLGAQLLGVEEKINLSSIDYHEWKTLLFDVWKPILLGSGILSLITGLAGYYGIQLFWVLEVNRRWRKRPRQ
jgi:hypothetical protein